MTQITYTNSLLDFEKSILKLYINPSADKSSENLITTTDDPDNSTGNDKTNTDINNIGVDEVVFTCLEHTGEGFHRYGSVLVG